MELEQDASRLGQNAALRASLRAAPCCRAAADPRPSSALPPAPACRLAAAGPVAYLQPIAEHPLFLPQYFTLDQWVSWRPCHPYAELLSSSAACQAPLRCQAARCGAAHAVPLLCMPRYACCPAAQACPPPLGLPQEPHIPQLQPHPRRQPHPGQQPHPRQQPLPWQQPLPGRQSHPWRQPHPGRQPRPEPRPEPGPEPGLQPWVWPQPGPAVSRPVPLHWPLQPAHHCTLALGAAASGA